MTKLILFSDSKYQCWARVKLASGEPVFISIGQGAVIMKRSRFGVFGAKLVQVDDIHQVVDLALRIDLLYGRSLAPPEMKNNILASFTQLALQSNSCVELCLRLRELLVCEKTVVKVSHGC